MTHFKQFLAAIAATLFPALSFGAAAQTTTNSTIAITGQIQGTCSNTTNSVDITQVAGASTQGTTGRHNFIDRIDREPVGQLVDVGVQSVEGGYAIVAGQQFPLTSRGLYVTLAPGKHTGVLHIPGQSAREIVFSVK